MDKFRRIADKWLDPPEYDDDVEDEEYDDEDDDRRN